MNYKDYIQACYSNCHIEDSMRMIKNYFRNSFSTFGVKQKKRYADREDDIEFGFIVGMMNVNRLSYINELGELIELRIYKKEFSLHDDKFLIAHRGEVYRYVYNL